MSDPSNSETNVDTELTMCDVLQEEQDLEEDANAVLGGSDDTNCSYDNGYVPRQALYACSTCSKDKEPAGICLACCYACHDGHEVVELYTKRDFRCDCGNSKFPENKCNLKPDKDAVNSKNNYNQNFRGVYCSCSRPYPDPEDSLADEMIQCVICEDWHHGRHIGGKVPENEDYGEMICKKCMESRPFLYPYINYYKRKIVVAEDVSNLTKTDTGSIKTETSDNLPVAKMEQENTKAETSENDLSVGKMEPDNMKAEASKSDLSVAKMEPDIMKPETSNQAELLKNTPKCFLSEIKTEKPIQKSGAVFWPEHWRKDLCHCSDCMQLYQENNCMFLLNPDDTIQSYEERGKCTNGESQYDKGLSALGQLDRVKQMEAIRAYTNMKGKLKEYLREFAANKRTVCESDIKEFFEQMGKRQKMNSGVPHFCR